MSIADYTGFLTRENRSLKQALTRAEARVRALEEALRPFAHAERPGECDSFEDGEDAGGWAALRPITFGDLRRARAQLAPVSAATTEEKPT